MCPLKRLAGPGLVLIGLLAVQGALAHGDENGYGNGYYGSPAYGYTPSPLSSSRSFSVQSHSYRHSRGWGNSYRDRYGYGGSYGNRGSYGRYCPPKQSYGPSYGPYSGSGASFYFHSD